jgi:hypothetical protein
MIFQQSIHIRSAIKKIMLLALFVGSLAQTHCSSISNVFSLDINGSLKFNKPTLSTSNAPVLPVNWSTGTTLWNYQKISFKPLGSGTFTIDENITTLDSSRFLYQGVFNPSSPLLNGLLA